MRGVGHRHERAVRCDGREWRDRRTRRTRTAKSCGSGAAVLALSPREAKLLEGDGGKRAVLREEHEVSRKAIAQGRPECSRCPVCSCAVLFSANRTRDRGCSKHPVFPAPSEKGGKRRCKPRALCVARMRSRIRVGWLERSETHHFCTVCAGIDGYRFAPPILRDCMTRRDLVPIVSKGETTTREASRIAHEQARADRMSHFAMQQNHHHGPC
jgi:hypothetical protein